MLFPWDLADEFNDAVNATAGPAEVRVGAESAQRRTEAAVLPCLFDHVFKENDCSDAAVEAVHTARYGP
eukprot:9482534-Pyramimonas_sp.AAC.1